MSTGPASGARLVLIGAGHGHLGLLLQARRLRARGLRVTLVSPPVFRYSGLASGVLSGRVSPHADEIDVGAIARRHGVEHLPVEAVAVDRRGRRVDLADGRAIGFDRLSLNVGSTVEHAGFGDETAGVWSAKPLDSLFRLRRQIEAEIAVCGAPPAILVAGAGRTGLESAAAIAGLMRRRGAAPRVTVVGNLDPAAGEPTHPAGWRRLQVHLAAAGVRLVEGRLAAWDGHSAMLACGRRLAVRHIVLATGLAANPLVGRLGLPIDPGGRLIVDATLRAPQDRRIFAVGDCAVVEGAWRPAQGVFGVRAVPTLLHNLAVADTAAPPRVFRPQRRWLSIMDLGDGFGFASLGGGWRLGRDMLWVKAVLDRNFLRPLRVAG